MIANAFLAATIDGSVAMKAAEADQTAQWFAPQLDELRKELDDARTALQTFQTKTNMVAPTAWAAIGRPPNTWRSPISCPAPERG